MDPISAFGLAVNILTVVDLSAKVISTASEIWAYGETIATSDRALVIKHLETRCQKLVRSAETATLHRRGEENDSLSSEDDIAILELAAEAKAIAEDIQRSLVKRHKSRSISKVLGSSVRTVWGEREVEEKTRRLQTIRDQLQFEVIVSIKSSFDVVALRTDQRLQTLDQTTQEMVQILLLNNDNILSEMDAHFKRMNKDLKQRLDQSERVAGQRHVELLSAITTGSRSTNVGATSATRKAIVSSIVQALWFSRMNDRYDDIDTAYRETFEWVFSNDTQLPSSHTFIKSMQGNSGLYWLSGRAGSGKSTLIKFIVNNERTHRLLRNWSNGGDLVTANYFFWDLSLDALQKSIEGLYRSILHDIVDSMPSFATLLFPDQFKAKKVAEDFPTSHELRRAFRRLVEAKSPPANVALFIDGLDEYAADEESQLHLAETLKLAAKSRHLKVIASSRPETVFEKAFADCDKLLLHELTNRDHQVYIHGNLNQHTRITYLMSLPGGQEAASSLITAAVERSEGIFLWTKLAVKELCKKLDTCNTILELRPVLEEFPRGLERLFLHMMRRIAKDRQHAGVQYLWLKRRSVAVLHTQSPIRKVGVEWSKTSLDFQITAICLDATEIQLDDILAWEPGPLSSEALKDTITKVRNRLTSCCAGLLELKSSVDDEGYISWPIRHGLPDPEISFIHRSVAEFLNLPSTLSQLDELATGTSFDVDKSLAKGLLGKLKREAKSANIRSAESPIWHIIELIMRLARHSSEADMCEIHAILHEMDRTMTLVANADRLVSHHWTNYFPWMRRIPGATRLSADFERSAGFLSIAVENGLAAFALGQLENPETQKLVKSRVGIPLLSSACRPSPFSRAIPGNIRPVIIRKLLSLGADPNQQYERPLVGASTPWKDLLKTVMNLEIMSIEGARQLSDMLSMMIQHGADLDQDAGWKSSGTGHDDHGVTRRPVNAVIRSIFLGYHYRSLSMVDITWKGEFVPFEDLDPSWQIQHSNWGQGTLTMYPTNSDPPTLSPADKEEIKRMGHTLLKLVGDDWRETAGNDSPGLVPSDTEHSCSTGDQGHIQEQWKVSRSSRFKKLPLRFWSKLQGRKS